MKRTSSIFIIIFHIFIGCSAAQNSSTEENTYGMTLDGQKIILHANGTWNFQDYIEPFYLHILKPQDFSEVSIENLIPCLVTDVVDGDTIWVHFTNPFYLTSSREKIRLLGINTPELNLKGSMELYAYEAKIYARQQLLNKIVYLAFDYIFRDSFGRLLAYVFFQNGICFNAQLVSQGYATLYKNKKILFYPQLQYLADLAKENNEGLWSGKPKKIYIETIFNKGYIEYIQLRNNCTDKVDLADWKLADDDGMSIELPDVVLHAGQSMKIYSGRDGIHDPPESYYLQKENIWGNTGDTVFLYNKNKEIVDRYTYYLPD